jgi:hypothetical protein
MQLTVVFVGVLLIFSIFAAIAYSIPSSRELMMPYLPAFIGGFALLLTLVGGGIAQLMYLENVRKKRFALIGDPHKPDPIKLNLTVVEALSKFEKCLSKVKEEDTLWTVENSDPQTGVYRASAYTYVVGAGQGASTLGYDNYVYIDASFIFDAATGETVVAWSYSYSDTTVFVGSRNTFALTKGASGKTVELINKANDRIRWALGFPILVGEKVCQPAEGAALPVEK